MSQKGIVMPPPVLEQLKWTTEVRISHILKMWILVFDHVVLYRWVDVTESEAER